MFFYTALNVLNFITFSTYAGTGNSLTPRKVFTAITLFSFIRLYCIQFMVLCLLSMSDMWVALKRIEVCSHKIAVPFIVLVLIL